MQAAEIIWVKPRQMRRIRWRVEHYGLDAIMDQRGATAPQADKGRHDRVAVPAQTRCLSRFLAAPFLRIRHRKTWRERLVQLAAADVARSRRGAERTSARQVPAPTRAPARGGYAATPRWRCAGSLQLRRWKSYVSLYQPRARRAAQRPAWLAEGVGFPVTNRE